MSFAQKFDKLIQSTDTIASMKIAERNWNPFKPIKSTNSTMTAVDGSIHHTDVSGLPITVQHAVAVDKFGTVGFEDTKVGFDLDEELIFLETKAVIHTLLKKPDRILADGSIYTIASQPALWEMYQQYMDELLNTTVCFISKSSLSKMSIKGPLTDAFYFSKGTSSAGFSNPIIDRKYSNCKAITSSFIRLADNAPLVKLELVGEHTEDEIKNVMNDISSTQIGGYPYELVLAHQQCLITKEDMDEIVSICGLSANEISRQVLK